MNFLLLRRIKQDRLFRIKMFLRLSVLCNIGYSIFLFVIGQIYSSKWFFVMSIYYELLSIARGFIFLQTNSTKDLVSRVKSMRICGIFLFFINLVVSIMIFLLIFGGHSVKHHEITVITLAAYTFFTLTVAIISSIRFIKENNYIYTCIKIISLVSASVSMITLTNTMLATFGEAEDRLKMIILPILSTFVSIFIIVCAIFLIYKANLDLRKLKNEEK